MEIFCTRPGCQRPQNRFPELDDPQRLKATQQKFCMTCGMPLILVGRYLPSQLLAQGGFGAAFLARDRYTPALRQCVVKQFQPTGLSPQQLITAQTLFQREAEVLEQLGRHPQIPDLFAFFELPVPGGRSGSPQEYFYLVQEFIDGQTLEQEVAQRGPFSEPELLEVLGDSLQVLQFVHENGAIHRDVKPSNIMRQKSQSPNHKRVLYLLDFGAVKQVTQAAAGPGHTTRICTPLFAAPEQVKGNQVYPSTDLYALGVTSLCLLTDKSPADLFDAANNRWIWRSQVTVSDGLAAVLERMLAAASTQRFQSAAEVLAALNQPAHASLSQAFSQSRTGPTPPPTSAPAPSPPVAQAAPSQQSRTAGAQASAAKPKRRSQRPPPVSLPVLLSGALFTGFEGGLLAIALTSFLGTTLMSGGLWLLMLAVLVVAQLRRIIERIDLVIIAAVTLGIVLFLASDPRVSFATPTIVLMATLAGLGTMAVAIVFRLIYGVLSRFL